MEFKGVEIEGGTHTNLGYVINPEDNQGINAGQTILQMPTYQVSLNQTSWSNPNALSGLEALSKITNLKFREPNFEKEALMEIGEKGHEGYEYFVIENKSENSMVIYTKEDKIEALKVIPDANKNVNVYHHDQILGKAGIEATAACSGGMARKVHILDKNGMLVCMLEMPQFGYDIAGEYYIKGNGNHLGKLKLKESKGYITWNVNVDVEVKALVLGSAFLIMESYESYNKIVLICGLLVFVLGIIGLVFKLVVAEY